MNISPTTWRLIISPPSKGAWNMALDEALLESIGRGDALPTLRLYAWDPPCLSLGYAQPFQEVDQEKLKAFGWDIVRRPTGGRAILHTDELTYSVTGPSDEPRLAGGVLESYRRLSQALLEALHLLNVPAEARENPSQSNNSQSSSPNNASGNSAVQPICFEVPSNYEITVGGKKLIGSAQARRKEGVLQHGSFPLWGDLTRITQVLVYSDQTKRVTAAERLLMRATTLEAVLNKQVAWKTVANAYCTAFEQVLNLKLVKEQPSQKELERAEVLMKEKYTHSSWNEKI